MGTGGINHPGAWALVRPFLSLVMDTLAGWVPSLRGNVLHQSTLASPFNARSPSLDDPSEKEWSRPFVTAQLEEYPDAKDAIYEAVLALWRLKMSERSSADRAEWSALTEAWLVSFLPKFPITDTVVLTQDRTVTSSCAMRPVPTSSNTLRRFGTTFSRESHLLKIAL